MGMEAPISVSVKLGDTSNVFRRIVDAAQRPHLSIPVTEAGKSYQHYKQIFGRSIMILSGKFSSLS
jgi:Ras family protein T1